MYIVQSKYPINANTMVVLYQDNPYCLINVELQGNHLEKDDETLVNLALEEFYQITYKNRAERENISELKKALEKSNDTVNVAQLAMLEMNEQHYDLAEEVELLKKYQGLILNHLGLEGTEDDAIEDANNNGDTENE